MSGSPEPTGDVWTDIYTPEDLGRFVTRLRQARGLTQAQLADELGISRQYIHEIERGEPNLYSTRLFSLLRLLNAGLRAHYASQP